MKNEKHLRGVYCDVDMTLIEPLFKRVNRKLLNDLERMSDEGKDVFLWTGGPIKEAKKNLSEIGISRFLVLSKYDYRGCTAENVIDDDTQEEFEKKYKIKAENYQEVNWEEWIREAGNGK